MGKSTFSLEYQIFLEALVAARKEARLTQEQLAQRLGQTQSWVSKAERGERRIDVTELRNICHALGRPFLLFVAGLEKALSPKRARHPTQTSPRTSKRGY
ncbi:MAG: helix-turn-helix domain-containing protein [Candidatus Binataceae bacterium]|nr:helix-turn-helix domain-containing protein [Candidatus Binataceae bacterium]